MLDLLITLGMLVLLQAVLGFDNLLYISLESKRAPEAQRAAVRKWGIGLAIGLRIVLLFALMSVIEVAQNVLFQADFGEVFAGQFTLHSLIVLAGGVFIIYTATKEIMHMMRIETDHHDESQPASSAKIVVMIVLMNIVFSFDSILSALALTKAKQVASPEFAVMAIAIVVSGLLMIWLSDRVASFLQQNRMYEVLGLFILFIVGIMLVSEGGHLAHMHLIGHEITPMTKGTFYLVIIVLVLTDLAQSRYQKKLLAQGAVTAQ